MTSEPCVAIVGATGAVGTELFRILEQRGEAIGELRLLGSRSAGTSLPFRGGRIVVGALERESFAGVDVALFAAGGEVSRSHAPRAVQAGAVAIDNSSVFRLQPGVPLIVPEVNGGLLDRFEAPGIIANPNCSTIIALMAATPLHRAVGVTRMVISTYQAASGAGTAAMQELEQQVRDHVTGRPYTQRIFDSPCLFNVFSHDSPIEGNGYNREEMKLVRETHKIWEDASIQVTATCIRVPVLRAHTESINLSFRETLAEDDARDLLAAASGVRLVDDRVGNRFPEPVEASGGDHVLVGRLRGDISQPPGRGLDLLVSADQLRKGAALNAVQIMERLQNCQRDC